MNKVVIIGGGIAGLTAGVYLQKAGYSVELYEKNAVVGGECTGWDREGFHIDNCIHWLTGSKPGSDLYDLWCETGALGENVPMIRPEMFYSSEYQGQKVTFWRDVERTRAEFLKLAPEDSAAINQLMDYTKMGEHMDVPVKKPFDRMKLTDYIKLGRSMADMGKVMKKYGKITMKELAARFQNPAIRQAIAEYLPEGYLAYAFLASYGTITAGNGDIPKGGSKAMAERMAARFQELGGVLHTGCSVREIAVAGAKAKGVYLEKKEELIPADYVIAACDTSFLFSQLLPEAYMPKALKKAYEERMKYPVFSGLQIAFAVEGVFEELEGTRFFGCEPMEIVGRTVTRLSTRGYQYEPSFAPDGKCILQSNVSQNESEFEYWQELYQNREAYQQKKQEYAQKVMEAVVAHDSFLKGKIRVLDVWTPMTYARYCNAYRGAYMGFTITKESKNQAIPGIIKGIDNVMVASQWLMSPGGLPTAAATGKFAAQRIIER